MPLNLVSEARLQSRCLAWRGASGLDCHIKVALDCHIKVYLDCHIKVAAPFMLEGARGLLTEGWGLGRARIRVECDMLMPCRAWAGLGLGWGSGLDLGWGSGLGLEDKAQKCSVSFSF